MICIYLPCLDLVDIIFLKSFYYCYSTKFVCRIMFAGSPPRRVRQRLVEDRAAIQAKIMDRSVIAE